MALAGLLHRLADLRRASRSAKAAAPTRWQPQLGRVFTGMANKWWVDELYQRRHRPPLSAGCRAFLANPVDLGLIDGIVNGLGTG